MKTVATRAWLVAVLTVAGCGAEAPDFVLDVAKEREDAGRPPVDDVNGEGNDAGPGGDAGQQGQAGDGDQPPVDEPPVDEPPVDEPPVDEPPVDEPPVDEPPVMEACKNFDRDGVYLVGVTDAFNSEREIVVPLDGSDSACTSLYSWAAFAARPHIRSSDGRLVYLDAVTGDARLFTPDPLTWDDGLGRYTAAADQSANDEALVTACGAGEVRDLDGAPDSDDLLLLCGDNSRVWSDGTPLPSALTTVWGVGPSRLVLGETEDAWVVVDGNGDIHELSHQPTYATAWVGCSRAHDGNLRFVLDDLGVSKLYEVNAQGSVSLVGSFADEPDEITGSNGNCALDASWALHRIMRVPDGSEEKKAVVKMPLVLLGGQGGKASYLYDERDTPASDLESSPPRLYVHSWADNTIAVIGGR